MCTCARVHIWLVLKVLAFIVYSLVAEPGEEGEGPPDAPPPPHHHARDERRAAEYAPRSLSSSPSFFSNSPPMEEAEGVGLLAGQGDGVLRESTATPSDLPTAEVGPGGVIRREREAVGVVKVVGLRVVGERGRWCSPGCGQRGVGIVRSV